MVQGVDVIRADLVLEAAAAVAIRDICAFCVSVWIPMLLVSRAHVGPAGVADAAEMEPPMSGIATIGTMTAAAAAASRALRLPDSSHCFYSNMFWLSP